MVDNAVFTVFAIIEALLWFFAVPSILKPYWEKAWSQYSPLQSQLMLNMLGILYFLLIGAMILPIYAFEMKFFERYKISDKVWAWKSDKKEVRDEFWALSRRSLRFFVVNYGMLVPLLTVLKFYLLGDNMSFSTSDWPSYYTLAKHNLAMTVIHEFAFYWSHRLAHHPRLYKFHKVHHEYKQNTILASQHEHPIDYIVTIATPALCAVSIVNPHSITLFQWIAWLLVANIDDHLGYAFPWSPVRWFPLASQTDQHEFHHSRNMGCFASKLNIYDKLFDSEAPYLEWRRKKTAETEKKRI